MTNIAPELPPPGLPPAPEGGEIGPVQSGWRLAMREFAQNRLAVLGLAGLIFFVLFCYLGPLNGKCVVQLTARGERLLEGLTYHTREELRSAIPALVTTLRKLTKSTRNGAHTGRKSSVPPKG